MERIERIHALHRILSAARYPVTVQRLQEDLECSRATVYRDLAYLRTDREFRAFHLTPV